MHYTETIREFTNSEFSKLGSTIGLAKPEAKTVTTKSHDYFLYENDVSRWFEPPFFLKPRPQ